MAANYNAEPLLEVNGLKQYFQVSRTYAVRAVDDVSFKIWPGETYSLVGESGSGKSTIGRAVIRLYNPTAGTVQFNGMDISGKMSRQTEKNLRRQMQMIFQDPMASLNPRKTIGDIIGEGLDIHHSCQNAGEREARIKAMLRKVGLDPEHHSRYPHRFSGGQRQRVGIARALMMNPKLIIADECISALDVSIQAQVVNLMKDIQEETGTAYLFIAHDLAMVKYISDRIGVLHLGHCWRPDPRMKSSHARFIHTREVFCLPFLCRIRLWKNRGLLKFTTIRLPASTTTRGRTILSRAHTMCGARIRSLKNGSVLLPTLAFLAQISYTETNVSGDEGVREADAIRR